MIFVGIDVAKDKHDCFILNSEGTVLADVFTIANNRIGFETLLSRIQSCSQGESKIKVGLEATGHYSYNLLGFLLDSGLATYVINPLHTNLYRKSLSLRRTKTDRIDARTIAMMLMSDVEYERQIELVFEGQRWFDLRRWKKMYEEYSKPIYGVTIGKFKNEDGTYRKEYWTDNIVSTRVFNNDKLYWVPVPRWELNKSKLIDAAPYE